MSQSDQNQPPVSAFANECVETRTMSKYKLMNVQGFFFFFFSFFTEIEPGII